MQVSVLIGTVSEVNQLADQVALLRLRPMRDVMKNKQWVREYGPAFPIWFFDGRAKKLLTSVREGDALSVRYELALHEDAVHLHAVEFINIGHAA